MQHQDERPGACLRDMHGEFADVDHTVRHAFDTGGEGIAGE